MTSERPAPDVNHRDAPAAHETHHEHIARYEFACAFADGADVLDAGCGVGRGAQRLAQAGARSVVAVDSSAGAIGQARMNHFHRAIAYRAGSVSAYSSPKIFDLVTCFDPAKLGAEPIDQLLTMVAALRDDGILIISAPKRASDHQPDLDADYVFEFLKNRFQNINIYFENKYSTSLIANSEPTSLDRIVPLTQRFDTSNADCLVYVATNAHASKIEAARPVLSLDDDSRRLALERDLKALTEAEAHAKIQNANLERQAQSLSASLQTAQNRIFGLQRQVEALNVEIETQRARQIDEAQDGQRMTMGLRDQLHAIQGEMRAQIAANEATTATLRAEASDYEDLLRVQADHLLRLHDEIAFLIERNDTLSAENAAVVGENFRLDSELRRLQRENEALQAENLDLKSVLHRFRSSVSWAVTKPIRSIGRAWINMRRSLRGPASLPHGDSRSDASNNPGSSAPQPDILFVNGCLEGESKRYRIYNLIEGLADWGYSAEVINYSQCSSIVERRLTPKVAVFFRAPFDPASGVTSTLEYFRNAGIRTIFDVDDYVFEPSIVDQIAGISAFSTHDRHQYEWGVRAYRSMLFSCDAATVTTPYLAARMRELGREAAVISNTINASQKERAIALLSTPREPSDAIRIGYFSGSPTHARDFQECAAALQAILRKNATVIFQLVGHLELDESWNAFAGRIERSGLLPPLDMLDGLARCDINLAPLEEGNAFCEGKSELKYFEAALVEVPTIASRTVTYAGTIEDGVDGVLASGTEEWEAKLQALIDAPSLRRRIGAAARTVALSRFNTDVAARQALVAYGLEPAHAQDRENRSDTLKIGWLVPGLIFGSGGHRNILRAAYHLERFGHDVRLYFSDTTMTESELRVGVRRHFYPFEGPISRFDGRVEHEDVLMATHWSTVALAESVQTQVGEIMYFVQDFEPAFYPMGAEYLLAENTYRKSLYGISSGPWCEQLLRDRYGMTVDHFRFPIDREIYNTQHTRPRANQVIFFAKPEMPRRCYQIGVSALRELHRLRPDVEIVFFGSAAAGEALDFPVRFAGLLPKVEDLAILYATATLGVVFSTTNPSLVPFEMMACGLPVVDIAVPGNEVNYDNRTDIALLADPDPITMGRQIAALYGDPEALASRAASGLAFTEGFPTEQQMARRIEALILTRYADAVSKPATKTRSPKKIARRTGDAA